MANEKLKDALEKEKLVPKDLSLSLEKILQRVDVRARFEKMLGAESAGFLSSVLTLANSKKEFDGVNPYSILASAATAAALHLPVVPGLGMAHIIPYKDMAQFQMGWKGFVQLAIRTAQYKTMNCSVVYDGELIGWDRIRGNFEYNLDRRKSDEVIGYVSHFELKAGYERWFYMTKAEMTAHSEKYSKSFESSQGQWKLGPNGMSLKTVMKLLLGKWGPLSTDLQTAIIADQSVVIDTTAEEQRFTYPDNQDVEPKGIAAPTGTDRLDDLLKAKLRKPHPAMRVDKEILEKPIERKFVDSDEPPPASGAPTTEIPFGD